MFFLFFSPAHCPHETLLCVSRGNLTWDIPAAHRGGNAQHKGSECCRNERWVYHRGPGTANKSPDAGVMHVDVSLVPFHYSYQRPFLQMSREWKISGPVAAAVTTHRSSRRNFLLGASTVTTRRVQATSSAKLCNIRAVPLLWSCSTPTPPHPTPVCLFAFSPRPSECMKTRQAVL